MPLFNATTISRSVASRRVMARLSQQDLSKKSGVSVSAIRRLERGEGSMSVENFCYIAEALDCSLDDLLRLPQ